MDNKLITGAILLLIVQAFLLIADVDLYPSDANNMTSTQQSPIGVILNKRQDVKRRSQGSIVWEESSSADTLLSFDSLLTLDNSSAKIQLENDIEIDLHENTLIVIEPNEKQENGSLKVRFTRGNLLSSNKNKALQLGTSDWEISVTPGTGLSLKSSSDKNVEVEVTKGEIKVVNKNNPQIQSVISSGVRQALTKNALGVAYSISENLKINLRDEERIYTHRNEEDFLVRWQGEAKTLRVIESNKSEKQYAIEKNQHELLLNFKYGTHNLSLVNDQQKVSREIRLRVLPAPRIRYTSPLPRDRFQISDPIFFSWTPVDDIKSYELELTNTSSERERLPTTMSSLKASPRVQGALNFRVFGIDDEGFRIPPYYSQPLFIVPAPFAPPKIRVPASEPDSALFRWFNTIYQFILPHAAAEEIMPPPPAEKISITFNWFAVAGADFYTIEISSRPDFQTPEIIQKVSKESFNWTNFEKKEYYWRVAAGSHSGRMGLFSDMAKIDLTNIESVDVTEISPGVKIVRTKELTTKNREPVKPVEPIPPAPPVEQVAPAVPDAAAAKLKWTHSVEANFHHLNYNMKHDFSAGLTGFANASAAYSALGKNEMGDAYSLQLQVTQIEWTAESQATLPFQDDIKTLEIGAVGLRLKNNQDFSFGVAAKSFSILERVGLEKLKDKSIFAVGPAMGYANSVADNMVFMSNAALLYGDEIFSLATNNKINYVIRPSGPTFYLGGDLNFQIFFGPDSLSGFYLKSGLHIGYSF